MINISKNSRSGQITLIAILLGVLGLTVGLSVASRSLSDLKQASFVDFGTKAFAAAEAGAELGLNDINTGAPINCNPNSPNVAYDKSRAVNPLPFTSSYGLDTLTYTICPDSNHYFRKDATADNVVQVSMSGNGTNNNYIVFWQDSAKGAEVTALYRNYAVKRYAFYSRTNGFPTSSNLDPSVDPTFFPPNCPSFPGMIWSNANSGGGIRIPALDAPNGPVIQLRVRPLGGGSTIQICGDGSGVESQVYVVQATAKTTNNTTRRVQVTKELYGTLPSVFDNVIYSGRDLTK